MKKKADKSMELTQKVEVVDQFTEDKIIRDTTMMFMACACLALNERNKFGRGRLMQFMADVIQLNNQYEFIELKEVLKNNLKIDIFEKLIEDGGQEG